MLTLAQILTPITQAQALATLLKSLQQAGFQATSWQNGSVQLTFLNLIAMVWAAVSQTISNIAAGGFTTLANVQYAYLSLVAQFWYDLTPLAPIATIGEILLTSSATAGSTTFSAGDLIVADQPNGTSGANIYTNVASGTLGPSSTLLVQFRALSPGAAANIPPNTTLYLWSAGFVGITVSNPVIVGTGTWISTPGQDKESAARLAMRCLLRWSALTYGNVDGAYLFWSFQALPSLTRATVLSAPGNGNVTVVGANALGPISGGDCTTIENYIYGRSDGIGRRPINDIFTAVPASTVTSPSLTVTVYCLPSVVSPPSGPSMVDLVTEAILGYIGSVPIGGEVLTGTQGRVLFSALMGFPFADGSPGIYENIAGLRSLTLSIGSDILLSPGQIYSPVVTVNPIAVAPGA